MSHHDGSNDEIMSKIAERFKLGATGQFPLGKITPQDEGEIKIAVGIEKGKIIIHFGKEVAWIGFTRKEAVELAESLKEKAMLL